VKGPSQGEVECITGGLAYKAHFDVIQGMLHLHIAGHRTVVATLTPDATNMESARDVLKLFAEAQGSI
jgi:hypothetical protein